MQLTTASKILAVTATTLMLATVGAFSASNANAQLIGPPNSGFTRPGYLTIDAAIVNTAVLDAALVTDGVIPTDGSGGAFGYGIVTSAGLSAIIVATTHQGVRDSVTQGTDSGPIWHTHFVRLAVISTGPCGSNPQVTAITFQQPGRVFIADNVAVFVGIPPSFTGTDALTGKPLTLSPGHNVQNVVSFVLVPKFQGGSLRAVCVEDTTSAQHIIKV